MNCRRPCAEYTWCHGNASSRYWLFELEEGHEQPSITKTKWIIQISLRVVAAILPAENGNRFRPSIPVVAKDTAVYREPPHVGQGCGSDE
jgi:hypothetical protein